MLQKRSVLGLGVILGYLLPSLEKNTRARAALDNMEQALNKGYSAYREAIATQSSSSKAHKGLLQSLRSVQGSLRVLSGDLEEGGHHLISTAADAVRLLNGIKLYKSLSDMACGVVDFQPDLRFSLTEEDSIEAFLASGSKKVRVLGRLFEACGRYGCRLLEAEWNISKQGLDGSGEASRAVAQAYYQCCCKTLMTLLERMADVDDRWRDSAKRLSTAFSCSR